MTEEMLTTIIAMAQEATSLAVIRRGSLPPEDGLCMEVASGAPEAQFLDRRCVMSLSVVCNGRHSDLAALTCALDAIHRRLTRPAEYPVADAWQMLGIRTTVSPHVINRESGRWLMASALEVSAYID
ncbi:MAG: hypothetical protein ACI4O7_08180 [Aristaeellaceae bacterium]